MFQRVPNRKRGPSGSAINTASGGNAFSEHKITNLFTAGGRLGYAWDRFMIFGSGGWASADLKGTYCAELPAVFAVPAR